MGKDEGLFSQFKDEKSTSDESWRSGSMWNCFAEYDVCWMTTFCQPSMVSRVWNAGKFPHKPHSQNWPLCLGLCLCPIATPCVVCHLRGAVRKIGDSSSSKDNPRAWIPGMQTCVSCAHTASFHTGSSIEDAACAFCCGPCTVCHLGRELKQRGYPCGTICERTE